LANKGQQCQLGAFSRYYADAYLNEMGITSPLFPNENTSSGRDVSFGTGRSILYKTLRDDCVDVIAFADFIAVNQKLLHAARSIAQVNAGETIIRQIGCSVCHVPSIVTAILEL
jgi:CxxC motif-containing protein (DUF1111 family)